MLELRDIKFSVKEDDGKQKDIINGISLKIDESKFVAITGPNGSGKSTLAKLIVGMSSARSITAGGVPRIFTPFFSKSAARFRGV